MKKSNKNLEATDKIATNERRIIVKINNKIIESEDIILDNEEIELLKKVLFNNKINLCSSCSAKVCLANKAALTGPIFEGITSYNDSLITKCANYR